MNDIRPATGKGHTVIRWTARLSSLAVSSAYLFILFLAVTNEEKTRIAGIPVLVLLIVTMLSCFAAWRWERAAGIAVLFSASCLGVAAYWASRTFSLGPHFVAPLIYATPGLLVGALFLVAARAQRTSGPRSERRPEEGRTCEG